MSGSRKRTRAGSTGDANSGATKRARTTSPPSPPPPSVVIEVVPDAPAVNIDELAVGSYVTRMNQYRITAVDDARVHIEDATGFAFNATRDIIATDCISASQFTSTEDVAMTQLAQIFHDIESGVVFTVHFTKKPKNDDSFETLRTYFVENGDFLNRAFDDLNRGAKTKTRKAFTAATTGAERVLTGYKPEGVQDSLLGRAKVVDLHLSNPGPADEGHVTARDRQQPERLVDYRTLKGLIVRNVRYILKGHKTKTLLPTSGKAY